MPRSTEEAEAAGVWFVEADLEDIFEEEFGESWEDFEIELEEELEMELEDVELEAAAEPEAPDVFIIEDSEIDDIFGESEIDIDEPPF